ncbi:MAG: methyl-accepting chemotaxis protein [Neorhizobium sp.]|nr:methyl-accepting chemotaxis protein [Neorhizobium sp.]
MVAQDVRELAPRSAKATERIKVLITRSADQVRRGVTHVGETGSALKAILTQVGGISSNAAAIVDRIREQAAGLKGNGKAINLMDESTQQNAAMVGQTLASAAISQPKRRHDAICWRDLDLGNHHRLKL